MPARKPSAKAGEVRLIAGRWRGRKLHFHGGDGLRPTGARIRETLFNWLMYEIEGANCLDLFAGSGVLGFEALSRGAASVTAVELDRRVAGQLEDSARQLGADGYRVYCQDAARWLESQVVRPFDIVFLDPPFADDALVEAAGLLDKLGWLAPAALVYMEVARGESLRARLPTHWEPHRESSAGAVSYCLYRAGECA